MPDSGPPAAGQPMSYAQNSVLFTSTRLLVTCSPALICDSIPYEQQTNLILYERGEVFELGEGEGRPLHYPAVEGKT